jgi:mannitol-1-/sugar-/sorbitol-6-/2-deoxyglucose-6-phosphatase
MIKAVIFDMDGLLVDSMPLWREAEQDTARLVGIDISEEHFLATAAFKPDEVVRWWFENIKEWEAPSQKEIEERLVKKLISLVEEKGVAKPGALKILTQKRKRKVKIALASASPMRIIDAALSKVGIRDFFDEIYSAEFEKRGKPHPDVYLTAARKLGFHPEECLVFEDSLNGLLAAKSAGMKCVVVPDQEQTKNKRFSSADEILESLEDFEEEHWKKMNRH